MNVRRQPATSPLTTFASVDGENIHTAIAAGIREDLQEVYPNIHFQVFAPTKDARLPGDKRAFTHANISFVFTMRREYCDRQQPLNHSGVIKIDNGICLLKISDPTNLMSDAVPYVEAEYPLEIPNFPQVLYDRLTPILTNATVSRENSTRVEGTVRSFPYEIVLNTPRGQNQRARHLTNAHDGAVVTTFCGREFDRDKIKKIQQSEEFTRQSDARSWCWNCWDSKQSRELR